MKEITIRYLEDKATEDEKAQLLHWLKNKGNRKEFNLYKSEWEKGLDKEIFPGGGEKTWNRIESIILGKSVLELQKSYRTGQFFKYAAVFLLLTTLGGIIFSLINRTNLPAVMTTRVVAQNGQMSNIVLPDGSKIWLNSASVLEYDNYYGQKNRTLHLQGEAYFEIAKNKKIPVLVNCDQLTVKVTGTKFDVCAIPGKNKIDVILEEGNVKISGSSFPTKYLNPGEMAVWNMNKKNLEISQVNTTKYTSWKEGIINIYDLPLDEVALKLKARYNQEFIVNENVRHYHYTFTIKNESLPEILALIQKITPVKAEQIGNIITLKNDDKRIKTEK